MTRVFGEGAQKLHVQFVENESVSVVYIKEVRGPETFARQLCLVSLSAHESVNVIYVMRT